VVVSGRFIAAWNGGQTNGGRGRPSEVAAAALPQLPSAQDLACGFTPQQHCGVPPSLQAMCWLCAPYMLPMHSHVVPIHMGVHREYIESKAGATRERAFTWPARHANPRGSFRGVVRVGNRGKDTCGQESNYRQPKRPATPNRLKSIPGPLQNYAYGSGGVSLWLTSVRNVR
jgi:hypothetical protein